MASHAVMDPNVKDMAVVANHFVHEAKVADHDLKEVAFKDGKDKGDSTAKGAAGFAPINGRAIIASVEETVSNAPNEVEDLATKKEAEGSDVINLLAASGRAVIAKWVVASAIQTDHLDRSQVRAMEASKKPVHEAEATANARAGSGRNEEMMIESRLSNQE
jgi:hypothetical protein